MNDAMQKWEADRRASWLRYLRTRLSAAQNEAARYERMITESERKQ